ncbi:Cyclin-dependent protein kinase inhibitor SMR6 [Sesamum alatum]|uniref:Cyclin-dependent protein kinase inhibitor SMR6 n=1 Tax=Sesamum alatum TaxID=300844 RepID=A0AAE1Y9S6_9LAMI|nr:Cyclin-dependent protein kinase inhibitor SMR6 [Sesamum alatum]
MGYSKKHQVEVGKESEAKKWVIAGIAIMAPLKPVSTKAREECEDEDSSTTPTARESRIPEKLKCPPAPRKRRPASTCHFNGVREFFNPPDLESVFICHTERVRVSRV